MLRRLGQSLVSVLLVANLAACTGFHLRGADSALLAPLKDQAVLVQGLEPNSSFSKKLTAALEQAGAKLAIEAPVSLQLNINYFKEDKTATAYSAERQVREFNHFLDLRFTAESKTNPNLKPLESSIYVERNQIYDSRYVLGVSEEERSIQAELETEAARLLALRLAALR